MPEPIRVYADTSVFGGVFDKEFERFSRPFFDQAQQGRFVLATSALVEDELAAAPVQVSQFFADLIAIMEWVDVTPEAESLQHAYLDAGVVSERSAEDALHVALATTGGCGVLVSWNFKHIVHIERGPRYNAVNLLRGYPSVDIRSPAEVIRYEEGL